MPMLQIDGVAIAEIYQAKADQLLGWAKNNVGKVREPAGFQGQTLTERRRPSAPTTAVSLTIEFEIQP